MVGSTGRNTGKTEFACALIRSLKERYTVHAVKITTIYDGCTTCIRGDEGCGVCTSMKGELRLNEELRPGGKKDTSRMLEAGAERVWWLRVRERSLADAAKELTELVPEDGILVFESNSIRRVCEPDLFFMLGSPENAEVKESAKAVFGEVDRMVAFDGKTFDFNIGSISLKNGRCVYPHNAAAVLLAGGQSSRMGSDKRYLDIEGAPLVEHVYNQLDASFAEVLLSVAGTPVPGLPDTRQIPDRYPDTGPLGGVASALEKSEFMVNFVTACDIPYIPIFLVQKMLRLSKHYQIVVPVNRSGKLETLFAVYSRAVLPLMKELLGGGERRIRMLYDKVDTCYVDIPLWMNLRNLNTREDYQAYLAG